MWWMGEQAGDNKSGSVASTVGDIFRFLNGPFCLYSVFFKQTLQILQ